MMEEQMMKLLEDLEEMRKFIETRNAEEVVSAVTKCVKQGKTKAISLIKSVLKASKFTDSPNVELCTKLYKKLFQLFQNDEINKDSLSIIGLLLMEVDSLPTECLATLAKYFAESIKNGLLTGGKGSDLFPKILSVINTSKEIRDGEDCIKGSEFKSHIINSLCSSRWKPSAAVIIATLLHDVPLTGDELKFVINKIIRMFPEIDICDQPALVFQLLQLSSKGHKGLVLEGITNFYKVEDDKQRGRSIMIDSEDLISDSTCLTTLRQVEGTVILHIVQAVKQDQELGRELIKYIKVLQQSDALKAIAPFNLLLLLSVSQLHHCEDQIFDFVKTTVFKCIRDEMRQQRSLWIQECFPIKIKTTELVLEAVEHSTYDWDHVIQSLVQLGFDLMESYGPRLVFGQISEAPIPDESHMTAQQLACKLGRQLLLKTFKAHEIVRSEILDQIFKNIITRSTQPVVHYLDLLSDTVYSAPQLLLQSSTKVQQVILELAHLPPSTAQNVLSAIQPLLKLSPMLKDSLLLVLRKAMFSRLLDSRKIGAMGFLTILKNFRVVGGLPSSQVSQPFALSQIQADVHAKYNAASNEALCLEILGNLRRCFTQQADVRLNVYQGMYEVLHRNSQLRNPVLDMLLSQIKKYYEQNEDSSPPLRLEPTIQIQGEQVYLVEPLSHLLKCTQQCVRKSMDIASHMSSMEDGDDDDDEENRELSFVQLKTILASMVKRMIDASIEDFELDKNSDFSLTNSVGTKNNIYAIHLIGVYEILIEYVAETGNFSTESCTQISQLFGGYSSLTSMVKDKLGGKKGKTSSKTAMSLMSLECLIHLLKAFINNPNTAHEEGINILRQCKDLFSHLVSVALQKLEQVTSKGFPEGELRREEKVFNDCCIMGRLFYLHYVENQVANDAAGDREKSTTSQCLEALSQVITTASSKGDQAIFHCLSHLEKDMDDDDKKAYVRSEQVIEKVHTHIKKMQRLITTILNESHDHQNWKEMSTLLSIIAQLSSHLPGHSEQSQQTNTWLLKVATDETVEDASCCKQLISSLLSSAKNKSLPQLLLNLCQDLHTQFGHIDKDYEVDDKTHYNMTKSTCCPPSSILMLVLTQMDLEIDDIDWVIRKHKANTAVVASAEEDDNLGATQMEQMDRSLCTRLGMLVNGFVELCHSAITAKVNAHALLKSLTKLYTTLSNLAKFYLGLYTSKSGHMGSRFEKLINLVGRQLTQPAYCIISYVQMTESDQISHDGEKKEKGKKDGTNAAQSGMAKAMKQMKITSNLIFAIEQLEKFLIQLSKKSKINLMESFKLSTSRDFRINAEITTKAVDEGVSSSDDGDEDKGDDDQKSAGEDNSESEEESHNSGKEEEQEEEPPSKKSKLGKKKSKT